MSCKSPNIIYCITCKSCKKQYVGQTKLRCMDRIQAHFNTIQSRDPKQETDISRHFKQADYHGRSDVQVHILDLFMHSLTVDVPRSSEMRLNSNGSTDYAHSCPWALTPWTSHVLRLTIAKNPKLVPKLRKSECLISTSESAHQNVTWTQTGLQVRILPLPALTLGH